MSEPIKKLTAANLAALLCARICHDLVSPVGALSAALEVFDDDDNMDMRDDAIELIKLSSAQASAKLQYLRLAFGAGGSAPGVIGLEELRNYVSGLYGDGKVSVEWNTDLAGLEKTAARILLNLIMLGVQAVPRGGTVTITLNKDNSMDIRLVAEGAHSRLDQNVVHTLGGGAPEDGFDGRTIQPFYTGMITREAGGKVAATTEGDAVVFNAVVPLD